MPFVLAEMTSRISKMILSIEEILLWISVIKVYTSEYEIRDICITYSEVVLVKTAGHTRQDLHCSQE